MDTLSIVRNPLHRRHRPAVIGGLMGLIAVAGACSGSTDSNEAQAEAYCSATGEVAGLESLLSPDSLGDPAQVERAFRAFREELDAVTSVAPDVIESDLETLGNAVDDVIGTLEESGFDVAQLDTASAERLATPLGRTKVRSAVARIEAYDTLNCAPASDPTTTAASPLSDSAAEYVELITSTLTEDEIKVALAYTEAASVSELVAKISTGEVSIEEIDLLLQKRAEGVPFAYGDDIDLDILWRACQDDDWAACDGLFVAAPYESLYQRFASTCGRDLDEPVAGTCEADLAGDA